MLVDHTFSVHAALRSVGTGVLTLVAMWGGTAAGQVQGWTRRTTLTGTSESVMAFDSNRRKVVCFTGYRYAAQTFEWNGTSWSFRSLGPLPISFENSMAYDTARRGTVLFGGSTTAGILGETWEWTGTFWSLRASDGPPPRRLGAMCHDPDRHVTILFGGAGGTDSRSLLGDTWTWDGTTWTHRNVPGPSPRMSCAMVFDSARHVAVLFGGVTQFNGPNIEPSGETWEWDGDAWTQRFVPGPEPRGSHAMVYDSRRRRTILHGGFTGTDAPNFMPANDTWEWNGVNWSRRLLRVSPILARHAMAFDSFRGVTVVHGGTTTAYSDSYETWELALACPADFNLDGNIDFFDYDDYVSCFEGTSCPPSTNADFNADGSIDFFDYDDFVAAFEAGC